ncbi:TIM barrel protein [Arenibaculum sp.]|uniref:TIM barrel protein n=1 Tax=Arenibaculum sp. TaxID=2865862 RepID=UPI002E11C775|nr:TIM barrel protein [Arenibaculum sp.]
MPAFSLKAAAIDYGQLEDRSRRLARLGLPVTLELHTFGGRDVDSQDGRRAALANLARLRDAFGEVAPTVHVPYQSVERVTREDFDEAQVERSVAFAREAGAHAVVVHRYWGLVFGDAPPRSTRAEATAGFNEAITRLARAAGDVRLLVENVGHYSLLPRDGRHILSGPLDHFFPWEIAAFRAHVEAERLANVGVFVDVAHATLSANLFNVRRARGAPVPDRRFDWITDDDLDRTDTLHPFDFVDPAMDYLHVSDSRLLAGHEWRAPDEPLLVEATCSEGMEVGTGNLPWAALPARLGGGARATLVLEVEPGPGDSHVSNGAQERSLRHLAKVFEA